MAYRIEYSSKAARQFRKLPRNIQKRLKADIDAFRDNPRPPGCIPYKSDPGTYRIRSGSYRVIYEIDDDILRVLVLKLGHRGNIYR